MSGESGLRLGGVRVDLGGRTIVDGVDLGVGPGEILGLVGPNGSGKSTLLRSIYRAVRPSAGAVLIDDTDVTTMRQRVLARRVAVVAQENPVDVEFRAHQLVMMGRTPHRGPLDGDSESDRELADTCLARVGANHLAQRGVTTLSGGEKQRVLLARALAQQAPLLLLDEPTNHLDVRAALDVLDVVHDLGLTTLCVLHDLNLAAAYCDRLAVLHRGRVHACGAPTEVLTAELIHEVFDTHVTVLAHPVTGRPLLAYAGSRVRGDRGVTVRTGLTSGQPEQREIRCGDGRS